MDKMEPREKIRATEMEYFRGHTLNRLSVHSDFREKKTLPFYLNNTMQGHSKNYNIPKIM